MQQMLISQKDLILLPDTFLEAVFQNFISCCQQLNLSSRPFSLLAVL